MRDVELSVKITSTCEGNTCFGRGGELSSLSTFSTISIN
uniref:Uncharacterized protein n=1 Tax=Rhizophora mucronata TaxID=61149 RepID=A0A2P2JDY7_RHIMU